MDVVVVAAAEEPRLGRYVNLGIGDAVSICGQIGMDGHGVGVHAAPALRSVEVHGMSRVRLEAPDDDEPRQSLAVLLEMAESPDRRLISRDADAGDLHPIAVVVEPSRSRDGSHEQRHGRRDAEDETHMDSYG